MSFAVMGIAAWRLFGIPELLFLTPAIYSLSHRIVYQGWNYINVDVLASAMGAFTIAAIACHAGSGNFWLSAICLEFHVD